jgi:hypothetical protein
MFLKADVDIVESFLTKIGSDNGRLVIEWTKNVEGFVTAVTISVKETKFRMGIHDDKYSNNIFYGWYTKFDREYSTVTLTSGGTILQSLSIVKAFLDEANIYLKERGETLFLPPELPKVNVPLVTHIKIFLYRFRNGIIQGIKRFFKWWTQLGFFGKMISFIGILIPIIILYLPSDREINVLVRSKSSKPADIEVEIFEINKVAFPDKKSQITFILQRSYLGDSITLKVTDIRLQFDSLYHFHISGIPTSIRFDKPEKRK